MTVAQDADSLILVAALPFAPPVVFVAWVPLYLKLPTVLAFCASR